MAQTQPHLEHSSTLHGKPDIRMYPQDHRLCERRNHAGFTSLFLASSLGPGIFETQKMYLTEQSVYDDGSWSSPKYKQPNQQWRSFTIPETEGMPALKHSTRLRGLHLLLASQEEHPLQCFTRF